MIPNYATTSAKAPRCCTINLSNDNRKPLKNRAIFTIPKKTMDFFEVTGGFRLGEPPARREGC
ncbi:MAG: hypothetical protein ACQEQO_01160 [Thermodesulfobacteriota bacterium]